MKKEWSIPKINSIDITETQYSPNGGEVFDGFWTSSDGTNIINTYS